jgi:hypothetical protein
MTAAKRRGRFLVPDSSTPAGTDTGARRRPASLQDESNPAAGFENAWGDRHELAMTAA